MSKVFVLGLAGRIGSGKTTLAKALADRTGATVLSFAKPLKEMCLALGLSYEQVYGSEKETPDYRLLGGKTPRFVQKTLGTEWGRDTINQNIWVDVFKAKVQDYLDKGVSVICDDLRFPNENECFDVIRDHQTTECFVTTCAITRFHSNDCLSGKFATHPSEALNLLTFENLIVNTGSVEEAVSKLERLVGYGS